MKRANKILFLLHTPPPVHGAALVGKFIFDSNVIRSNFQTVFINIGLSSRITNIGKGGLSKVKKFLSILMHIIYSMIFFRPNLVYVTLTTTPNGFLKDFFLVLMVKLFRSKIVYHLHNKGVSRFQNKLLYDLLYRFVFNNSKVILLSEHLYSDVEKYFDRESVYICPNGVPKVKAPFKKNTDGTVRIVFLSNLIESKGVLVLLGACRILKNKNLPFECNIIGGEGDISISYLKENISNLGLEDHVFYLGKKYDSDKYEALNDSNIFAFPTFYENECFPLVLLEAMQAKLTILSTPEGGIRSLIDDGINGFLVPQRNAELLADKLEYLIVNPEEREKMGVNGYDRYHRLYTLEKFEKQLSGILNKMIV